MNILFLLNYIALIVVLNNSPMPKNISKLYRDG